MVNFAKLHGLGNDFLVASGTEAGAASQSLASLAQNACRRHTGIGADGVIFYQPTLGDAGAEVSALIYNADGSRAEMSGNGTRCLAAYLVRSGKFSGRTLRIRTVAGIKTFTLKEQSGVKFVFDSSLGSPAFDPAVIPARLESPRVPVVGYALRVAAEVVPVTLSSMGNPHCSTFWPDVTRAPVEKLGPALERHACFPNRTNVEFIEVVDPHCIRVCFWERGVGITLASGTGSAAAAVAAILNGFVESPVRVKVANGDLMIQWQPPGELLLTGPAEYICDVEYPDAGSYD
jgi:diaminopimelate epimerase